MDPEKVYLEKLKEHGFSNTKTRSQVFSTLLSSYHKLLTINELISRTKGADRASIYRTVALFEKIGIVHRIYTGWKYHLELSDEFHDHHHHFVCAQCGSVMQVNDPELEARFKEIAAAQGFDLKHHYLEGSGVCAECSAINT